MPTDRRKSGRVTPRGRRPTHLRPVPDAGQDHSPLDWVIDSGGKLLLEEDDPIATELWASELLDAFDEGRRQAVVKDLEAPPFEEALLERCLERGDRRSAVVARALAAVVPPPLDHLADALAEGLAGNADVPERIAIAGRVAPTSAWVASDVFGDQESLVVGFRQEGQVGEHALVVLVDRNLGGQAKDAWIGSDLDDVVTAWKSNDDPHMRTVEIGVDDALALLRDAMATSELRPGDTEHRNEDYGRHRALIWSRLRRAGFPDAGTADRHVPESEREALVDAFLASAEGSAVAGAFPGAVIPSLARWVVDLRCDSEGRPLRWSPIVVDVLLGDLAPRNLLADVDQAVALPAVVRAFIRFSGRRSGLGAVFVDEILETVDEVEPYFLDRILQRSSRARLRSAPPARRSPAPDVVSAAASSVVLARFEAITNFYGDGRKLTQTGQPTMADARALTELLGTRDRIDEAFGDRTFKTRSAAELPELGFMIRWAKGAGALRKEHGKLRTTAAWRKLDGKPLQRWTKGADALPALGPLAAYHSHSRYHGGDEIVDEFLPQCLRLVTEGDKPYEEVLDWLCEEADAAYDWIAPYMQDGAHRRRSFRWDLDLLVRILEWAGIIVRLGATAEPERYDQERVVGGVLALTPLGRWWLTDRTD
jgi:hypothetical protein